MLLPMIMIWGKSHCHIEFYTALYFNMHNMFVVLVLNSQ